MKKTLREYGDCYDEMAWNGFAAFGHCMGKFKMDAEKKYIYTGCIECPYRAPLAGCKSRKAGQNV